MMATYLSHLDILVQSLGVVIPMNIKRDISYHLSDIHPNKHIAFVINSKTYKIESYGFNLYFKSSSFPYSIHAEVQAVSKYYKSRPMNRNKMWLVVVKLSRTGIIGNSKCCLSCMRFVRSNYDNLNLKKIFYSDLNQGLIELNRKDLKDQDFKYSNGYAIRN